jgi:hypothetical protein
MGTYPELCTVFAYPYVVIVVAGLIFDESVGPDVTLEPFQAKPRVRLLEEPKQSKVHYHTQSSISYTVYIVHVHALPPPPYDLISLHLICGIVSALRL